MVDFNINENEFNKPMDIVDTPENQESLNHMIDVSSRGDSVEINGHTYHIDKIHSANERESTLVNDIMKTFIRAVIDDLEDNNKDVNEQNLLKNAFQVLPFLLEDKPNFKEKIKLLIVLLTKSKLKHINTLNEDEIIELIISICRVNSGFLLEKAGVILTRLFKTAGIYLQMNQKGLEEN